MIHPLSSVHTDACIADGVEIGPFVTVAADVEIGEGTRILSNAVVMDGARIGRNCTSGSQIQGRVHACRSR